VTKATLTMIIIRTAAASLASSIECGNCSLVYHCYEVIRVLQCALEGYVRAAHDAADVRLFACCVLLTEARTGRP